MAYRGLPRVVPPNTATPRTHATPQRRQSSRDPAAAAVTRRRAYRVRRPAPLCRTLPILRHPRWPASIVALRFLRHHNRWPARIVVVESRVLFGVVSQCSMSINVYLYTYSVSQLLFSWNKGSYQARSLFQRGGGFESRRE